MYVYIYIYLDREREIYIYRDIDMKPLARLHSQRYQRHGWDFFGMEANKIWLFMAFQMVKTLEKLND